MGVAAARTPGPAKTPAVRTETTTRPRVVQVRQTSQLLQRACDCGATAGFSGHCTSCDRVSLEPRRGGDYAHATSGAPDVAADALRGSAPTPRPDTATVASEARLGHNFGRLGIHAVASPAPSSPSAAAPSHLSGRVAPVRPVQMTSPVRAQAQLRVSSPSDPAEQEARAMGKLVARMPEPAVVAGDAPIQRAGSGIAQRQIAPVISSASGDSSTVYRKETGTPMATPDIMASLQSGPSGGAPLPRDMRSFMEPRFGAEFSAVRVHADEQAAALCGQLNARAFTIGNHIYFGKGQFRTDTADGWELIAHELTHTIQQGSVAQLPAPRAHVPEPVKTAAAPAPAAKSAPAAATARVAEPVRPPAPAPVVKPVQAVAPAPVVKPVAAVAPVTVAAPVHAAAPAHAVAPAHAAAPSHAVAPVRAAAPARVAERAPASIQRLGLSDALDYFADKANLIPGFRMLTIILGINPINMSPVDRSAANILRALIEFIPGGGIITQALNNSGVFDKVGAWVSDQIATLAMTGAALKQAVTTFLGTLSWSDIFDLGGVWDRAKRIFTEPIDRLIEFGKGLVTGILKFIKDAILLPLAKLAEGTRGWDLLIAVLGKNPITGDAVPRTAETLVGGFLKLIGQDEVWANMQKANALPRAWTWFQSTMSALVAMVSALPDQFVAAFKSLTIEDVVLVVGAFQKVGSVFGGFLVNFISWAGNALWNLLEIIFDVVSPGAVTYIKKTGAALKGILKDPLPFVRNLGAGIKLGIGNFVTNFGTHLTDALIDWLTGSLPGVYIPKAISLVEFGKFALSVLGITWTQIRTKIVKGIGPSGETIMKGLETAFDIVVALVKGGAAAVWELIKEKLSDLKDTVLNGIISFVTETIIQKAVPKLISLFIPGAGFISAILSIYDMVKVFIEKLAKIVALVKSIVDAIVAIAGGDLSGAAKFVENGLTNLLTLTINFLAGFVGLTGIAEKVMAVVKKVQAAVDKALDTAIAWVINKAKALFAKLFGKGDKDDTRTDAQKQADLNSAMKDAEALRQSPNVLEADIRKGLPAIQKKYKMVSLDLVVDSQNVATEKVHFVGKINPELADEPKEIPKSPPGETIDNPIEIAWIKPPVEGYPDIIIPGMAPIKAKDGGTVGGETLKVTDSNALKIAPNAIIQAGDYLNLNSTKNRMRDTILKNNGWDRLKGGPLDVDHIWEKQVGGKDEISNLWPLNSDLNQKSGRLILSERTRIEKKYELSKRPKPGLKEKYLKLIFGGGGGS